MPPTIPMWRPTEEATEAEEATKEQDGAESIADRGKAPDQSTADDGAESMANHNATDDSDGWARNATDTSGTETLERDLAPSIEEEVDESAVEPAAETRTDGGGRWRRPTRNPGRHGTDAGGGSLRDVSAGSRRSRARPRADADQHHRDVLLQRVRLLRESGRRPASDSARRQRHGESVHAAHRLRGRVPHGSGLVLPDGKRTGQAHLPAAWRLRPGGPVQRHGGGVGRAKQCHRRLADDHDELLRVRRMPDQRRADARSCRETVPRRPRRTARQRTGGRLQRNCIAAAFRHGRTFGRRSYRRRRGGLLRADRPSRIGFTTWPGFFCSTPRTWAERSSAACATFRWTSPSITSQLPRLC